MIKLLIIADDFTGAVDTGIQFSKFGISTLVTADLCISFDLLEKDVQVLVADVESRHLSPSSAYDRVFQLTACAVNAGIKNYYKKTDSTLRGNIGSELAAILHASKLDAIYFVPAFPKLNRITKKGVQYVDGIPLANTIFANDPFTPVTSSFVPDIVSKQTNITVLTASPQMIAERQLNPSEPAIIVVDAETDKDLKMISDGLKCKEQHLLSGCAGFAEMLPKMIIFSKMDKLTKIKAERILVVCGSLNLISLKQVKQAELTGIDSMVFTLRQKSDSDYVSSSDCQVFIQEVSERIKKHKKLILKSVSGIKDTKSTFIPPQKDDLLGESLHTTIAANLGRLVKAILENIEVDLLIVFGGDTVYGIVGSLDYHGLMPQLEIFPGIVQSKLLCSKKDINLVTKAGGFGNKDTLVKVLEHYSSEVETLEVI